MVDEGGALEGGILDHDVMSSQPHFWRHIRGGGRQTPDEEVRAIESLLFRNDHAPVPATGRFVPRPDALVDLTAKYFILTGKAIERNG